MFPPSGEPSLVLSVAGVLGRSVSHVLRRTGFGEGEVRPWGEPCLLRDDLGHTCGSPTSARIRRFFAVEPSRFCTTIWIRHMVNAIWRIFRPHSQVVIYLVIEFYPRAPAVFAPHFENTNLLSSYICGCRGDVLCGSKHHSSIGKLYFLILRTFKASPALVLGFLKSHFYEFQCGLIFTWGNFPSEREVWNVLSFLENSQLFSPSEGFLLKLFTSSGEVSWVTLHVSSFLCWSFNIIVSLGCILGNSSLLFPS